MIPTLTFLRSFSFIQRNMASTCTEFAQRDEFRSFLSYATEGLQAKKLLAKGRVISQMEWLHKYGSSGWIKIISEVSLFSNPSIEYRVMENCPDYVVKCGIDMKPYHSPVRQKVFGFLPSIEPLSQRDNQNDRMTFFHWLIAKGDSDRIKAILDTGIDVNAFNEKGVTPLHTAVGSYHPQIVDLLMRHGADAKKQSSHRYYYGTACNFAKGERIDMLIKKKYAEKRQHSPSFLAFLEKCHPEIEEIRKEIRENPKKFNYYDGEEFLDMLSSSELAKLIKIQKIITLFKVKWGIDDPYEQLEYVY